MLIINRYRLFLNTILFLVVSVFFISCGKYEEGPAFSLLTKKSRITGTWETQEINNNGNTLYFEDNITLLTTLDNDGGGYYKITVLIPFESLTIPINITAELEWEFTNDKENLKITVEKENVDWGLLNPDNFNPDDFEFEFDDDMDFEFDEDTLIELFNINAKILRLTRSELWIEETNNSETVITKMIKTN